MENQKLILVTGGAGYVGSVLIPQLLAKGYRVRVFDKMLFGDEGLRAYHNRIELVVGDVLQPPKDLMDDVFAVIHLAGVSSQAKASNRSPRYTDLSNHTATEIMGRAAKAAGVERFVLASSCSIYCTFRHSPETPTPIYREADPVNICNAYALSKRASEEVLLELRDEAFHPVFLRKGTVYGYSPKMRYDLILNAFTKDAFTKCKITVSSGGELCRPMIDIQDAVAAYIAALELPLEAVSGEAFNVATSNKKIGELALDFQQIIKDVAGLEIDIELKPFEVAYSYQADPEKFQSVFGITPRRQLSDAIMETWSALVNGHNYNEERYYNDRWYDVLFQKSLL